MNVLGEGNPLGLGIWAWFLGLKSDASKMLRFYKALSATKTSSDASKMLRFHKAKRLKEPW